MHGTSSLDGFDLGIGILFPFAPDEKARDQMMASVEPFWDGNQTWLVLGGGGLLVAFPRAYSILMPALYLPVIVMLLGLIFRGVAFEFRGLANRKQGWNFSFAAGATVASFRARRHSWRPSCKASKSRTVLMPAARLTG